jgi:hypothetical protein
MHLVLSHLTIDEDTMLTRADEILLGRADYPNPTAIFV